MLFNYLRYFPPIQLGPVIASDDPVARVLERSLFDRLLAAKNVDSLMLDIQYRYTLIFIEFCNLGALEFKFIKS